MQVWKRRLLFLSVSEESATSLNELAHRWIDAFNNHDVPSIVGLYTKDAELFDSGMKRPRHGQREIEQWFTRRFEDIPSITYTPMGLFFAEVQVTVHWKVSGRLLHILGQRWLKRSFVVEGASIFTIRNGRIQKQCGYYDHLSVLQQILPPLKWLLPFRL